MCTSNIVVTVDVEQSMDLPRRTPYVGGKHFASPQKRIEMLITSECVQDGSTHLPSEIEHYYGIKNGKALIFEVRFRRCRRVLENMT